MSTASICWALALASFKGQLQYRMNFLTLVVFGVVYQVTGFVFIWVVLSHFPSIAGWGFGEIAFLYGLRLLVHALQGLVFGNLAQVEWQVRQADFDRYLVRPLAPLLQIMSVSIQVNQFGDLIGGVALFAAANALVGIDWSPLALAYLALALVGGTLAEGGIKLAVSSLAFRYLQISALWYLIDGILFSNFGNYPFSIYTGAVRFLLTFALPIAFVAYFPATVLLGRTDELSVASWLAYLAPAVGVLWFVAAYRLWQAEIGQYQSAGN